MNIFVLVPRQKILQKGRQASSQSRVNDVLRYLEDLVIILDLVPVPVLSSDHRNLCHRFQVFMARHMAREVRANDRLALLRYQARCRCSARRVRSTLRLFTRLDLRLDFVRPELHHLTEELEQPVVPIDRLAWLRLLPR